MAAQTGRTVGKWGDFIIGDASDVLRSIPVDSINDIGLDYKANKDRIELKKQKVLYFLKKSEELGMVEKVENET